jgi:hypothetical protein
MHWPHDLIRLGRQEGEQQMLASLALRLGEAAEIAGIVTAPELAQLANDFGIEVIEAGTRLEQLLDQVQADDVALDDGGVGRFWIVLQPEKA